MFAASLRVTPGFPPACVIAASEQTTTTATSTQLQNQYVYGASGQSGDASTDPAYLRQIIQIIKGGTFWS